MDQVLFSIFGGISFAVICVFVIVSIRSFRRKNGERKLLSALHLLTIGVFLATVLVFVPVNYLKYDFGDHFAFIRPFLISFHNAIRVFILNEEFSTIRNAVSGLATVPHVLFSFYAAALYAVAPVLTFSNVLSLFGDFMNEARFLLYRNRRLFIFSELNDKSVSLAESIASSVKKPVIVFADVLNEDREEQYERLTKVREINAIPLKKDVVRLNLARKTSSIEFFLIGENESENVEQAIQLTEMYRNDERRISVYVYSNKPSAGYILDSIDKGPNTIDRNIESRIKKNTKAFLNDIAESKEISCEIDSGFYIRRIDSIESLALKTLKNDELVRALFENNEDRTLSVTILGAGRYGKVFLQHVLWLYQVFGYTVEINVIDVQREEIVKQLGHEWPEIVDDAGEERFVRKEAGDCNYDLLFFNGVDCFSADFDDLFEDRSPDSERLKRTKVLIVTLGDDDRNIAASIMLRTLFERVAPSNGAKPYICTVVYDDRKTSNLSQQLVNYKKEEMNIRFVGSLSDQFSYGSLADMKALEKDALRYHLDWVQNDLKKGKTVDPQEVLKQIKNYVDFEYYRNSSISRASHGELINNPMIQFDRTHDGPVTEHMRWNAYMRVRGFRFAKNGSAMAKTHPDLVPWELVSEEDSSKDVFRIKPHDRRGEDSEDKT